MSAEERLAEWARTLPVSPPFDCSYLPRLAQQQQFYWAPSLGQMPGSMYQILMERRFRRSGRLFYRPVCADCQRCIPLRIAAGEFAESRSQLRARKKNSDLRIAWGPPVLDAARLELYARYTAQRHDKEPSEDLEGELRTFLYDSPTDTVETSYWLGSRLLAVGICDLTPLALSSVYFYFDPAESPRSLGVYSALVEIDYARATSRPYYYLGYWISESPKMAYKAGFGDHEVLVQGQWQRAARKL